MGEPMKTQVLNPIWPELLYELCKRPMLEAFKVYRDELDLDIYPCVSPKARVKSPGKQPAIPSWWEFNPHTCDLEEYFGAENGLCCNIGTCAKTELKYLDLDSKSDQGASVRALIETDPVLSRMPAHLTWGGAHLAFVCPDIPEWIKDNGRPYYDRLVAQVTDTIRAELFHCSRNNIILPPSVHLKDDFVYNWVKVGEVPIISWQEIFALCPWIVPEQTKRVPGRPKKKPPWYHRYRGGLASLNLVSLLTELQVPLDLINAEDCKYRIQCPWMSEHSDRAAGGSDTSTVIWQPGAPHWPSYKCLHAHCTGRELEQLLDWAETQSPGIVDRHCAQERVWSPGQKSAAGLPRILKPSNELDTVVYARIADIVAPHHQWFLRGETPVIISNVPSGYEYASDSDQKYKVNAYVTGFKLLTGAIAKSDLEKFAEPGFLNKEGEFIRSSFGPDWMNCMLVASQFQDCLPRIIRILTIPLPFQAGNKLVYPSEGY